MPGLEYSISRYFNLEELSIVAIVAFDDVFWKLFVCLLKTCLKRLRMGMPIVDEYQQSTVITEGKGQ